MDEYIKIWKLARDAYLGSGGFRDGSYLDKFIREDDAKYNARKEKAVYENIFSQKISKYTGYLFKERPNRLTKDILLYTIINDFDKRGNSIDIFMNSFAKTAKVMGVGIILIKMPSIIPDNLSTQIETRALPYAIKIPPESITSYTLDSFGNFKSISFNSTYAKGEEVLLSETTYDINGWAITERDTDKILESGLHNLGVCPVVAFSETRDFPATGEFTQIAQLSKKHYNLNSELDEILTAQTFNILTIQADNPSDISIKLSTDNAISYAKDCNKPEFIAPDANPADTFLKRISKIEDNIDKIAYDINTNKAQESGITLEIKFQGLNGSLNSFSSAMEDFEKRIFVVIKKYLNISSDISITYPSDFNISDIASDIGILADIKNLGYKLPTYEKLKLEQIINNDLSNLPAEDKIKISADIEDNFKAV